MPSLSNSVCISPDYSQNGSLYNVPTDGSVEPGVKELAPLLLKPSAHAKAAVSPVWYT